MNPEIKRIIIPTDFSEFAGRALEYGAKLADQLGASIKLLHVIPMGTLVNAASSGPAPAEAIAAAEAAAKKTLSEEGRRLARSVSVPVSTVVLEGPPPSAIVDLARTEADLIVLGTHGRTGLSHALLGSVAEYVVRHSPVPVLTIRAKPPA